MERRPGRRADIIRGQILVSPLRDGPHAEVLTDLRIKDSAYAAASIPVYAVIDRQHQQVHVHVDPVGGEYATHRVFAPGEIVALPDSIGAEVSLDVDEILKAGRPRP
ncbi:MULTISPECIES: Uma2 family endonuclease [unclassified Streptomyces]|uniref:Uma2 family endonuclease n=1 Tax=unclassified Streptomyces TaxID=2593676 RepID=UPI00343D1A35